MSSKRIFSPHKSDKESENKKRKTLFPDTSQSIGDNQDGQEGLSGTSKGSMKKVKSKMKKNKSKMKKAVSSVTSHLTGTTQDGQEKLSGNSKGSKKKAKSGKKNAVSPAAFQSTDANQDGQEKLIDNSKDSDAVAKSEKKKALFTATSHSIGANEANQAVPSTSANPGLFGAAGTNNLISEYKTARKKSYDTIPETIAQYKQDVSSVWVDKTTEFHPWYQAEPIILQCKEIDPQRRPAGFINANGSQREGRYQYDVTKPLKSEKRIRTAAHRTVFLDNPEYLNRKFVVTHLCRNNLCYNWDHHIFEPLSRSEGRTGCPGKCCQHTTKCLLPGKYCNS